MQEKVLMKGNEAIAEAAIRCGCRHYLGYPITPQTEIAAYMAKRMPKIGGVFLQAESEIAAINMVYGVASTGKLAMTSSSSPGIALKCEGISYLAGADLPALIVNVQRGGPGLGGIQPSQSDYFLATRGPGHGDFHVLVLAPASVQEMADLTQKAFRLAFEYRMPAMLLADGTMGQMMEPVVLPEETVLEKSAPDIRMILQVHDELVFEGPDARLRELAPEIAGRMCKVTALSVPLVADFGVGLQWDAAHTASGHASS